MLSICFIPLAAEVPVPFRFQVMVRVEKQRGHTLPKLVRSPERRKLSCLAMAEERDIIANREERKSHLPLSPYRCLTRFFSPGLSSPPHNPLPSTALREEEGISKNGMKKKKGSLLAYLLE